MPAMATKDRRSWHRQVRHPVTLNKALLIAQNDHIDRNKENGLGREKSPIFF